LHLSFIICKRASLLLIQFVHVIQVYLATIVIDLAFFGLFSLGAANALTSILTMQSKG
jgi:hypothetical protein